MFPRLVFRMVEYALYERDYFWPIPFTQTKLRDERPRSFENFLAYRFDGTIILRAIWGSKVMVSMDFSLQSLHDNIIRMNATV